MNSLLSDRTKTGKSRIKNITGLKSMRLLEMGLTPGAEIEIIRTAPLGFPIEIKIRGYFLSLRKSEAQCIELE
ncbi:MAG: FeoA family protein [Balneolales bacterium]